MPDSGPVPVIQLDHESIVAIANAIATSNSKNFKDLNEALQKTLTGVGRYTAGQTTTAGFVTVANGSDITTAFTSVYAAADSNFSSHYAVASQICGVGNYTITPKVSLNSLWQSIGTGTNTDSIQGQEKQTRDRMTACIDKIGLVEHFRVHEQPKALSDTADPTVPLNFEDYALSSMYPSGGQKYTTVVGKDGGDGLGTLVSVAQTVGGSDTIMISGPGASNSWDTDLGILATGMGALGAPAAGTVLNNGLYTKMATELTSSVVYGSHSPLNDAIQVVMVAGSDEECDEGGDT